ncbi:Replication protein A 70 kDa DNA-binding subunit, partial [Phytophthora cinnamomi]|uniref:Replication protein A 70 kDa DNA-binding subunit n=1 Tax=Phytophthora cinnamomi TaxID=4785 RepID=UPI003559AE42
MLYDDATIKRVLRAARAGQDWLGECDAWAASPRKPRGGRRNAKIDDAHIDYLISLLDGICYLTLDEMVDALEARFSLKVSRQTVKHHIDGRTYTVKQTHRDNNYRNLERNKLLRRDYVVNLLAYKAAGKTIFYVDETNFNLWCSRRRCRSLKGKRAVDKNTASKGSNIHVIACISKNGLAYSERRFGSFTSDKCNEFMRRLLRHISLTTPLHDVVIVADNAPCYTNVEDVFKEEAFSETKLLRLGPYSPMLNPIENCFSTFKAM